MTGKESGSPSIFYHVILVPNMLLTLHLFLRLESSVPLLVLGPKTHAFYMEDVAWVKRCLYLCQFVSPYWQNHCGSRKSNPVFWEWFYKEQSKRTSIFLHWVLYKWGVSVWKCPSLLYYLISTHSLLFFSVAVTWPYCGEMMLVDGVTSWSSHIGHWLVSVNFEDVCMKQLLKWFGLHKKVSHLF